MSKRANPTLIGLFVVGAVVLAVTAILVFGSGRFFQRTHLAVCYFDGSVRGLRPGAAVLFRGVPIGSVRDVTVVVDAESRELTIPVVIELDPGQVVYSDGGPDVSRPTGEAIGALVDRGLRAQLVVESLVTGQLLVEVDFRPEEPPVYRATTDVGLPEIPTVPTDLQEVRETLEGLIAQVQAIPIEELVQRATDLLASIDAVVDSPDVAETLAGVNRLINSEDTQRLTAKLRDTLGRVDGVLEDARQLVQNADARLEPLAAQLETLVEEVSATLAGARSLVDNARQLTGEDSELVARANLSLRELEGAMRSLKVLLDYMERHPDAVLRGKKGGQ